MADDYVSATALLLNKSASARRDHLLVFPPEVYEKHWVISDSLRSWLAFSDDPIHRPVRKLYNELLSIETMEKLRPQFKELVQASVAELQASGKRTIDLEKELALPLTLKQTAKLVGFPVEDIWKVRKYSQAVSWFVGHPPQPNLEEKCEHVQQAFEDYVQYCLALIEDHKANPGRGDFIDQMLQHPSEAAQSFRDDPQHFAYHLIDIIFASHGNTAHLVTMGLAHLLLPENSEELEKVRANVNLTNPLVEELLRLTSPTQMLGRVTTKETTFPSGVVLQADETVGVSLYKANHDPEAFPEPEKVKIGRQKRHLAFGNGIHICVGRALGRLMAQETLRELLHNPDFKDLRLANQNWELEDNLTFRSYHGVEVTW
eukprot:TRINITY_DN20604_c0_g1_i1.p1 TRINITY_DN20604_c0_g1~~TRINITY_DN20604_c0_g1_i1.p1  ORF type:complete len:404 (+),score=37.93 TRINITY_DN20604_c0_g1_i1:92-1213(+)